MSIEQIKQQDWLKKNQIMALGFGLASGLGLVAQLLQHSSMTIILSVAIPFAFAIIFYVLSMKISFVSKIFPYILILLTFAIAMSVIFFSAANLGTIGIIYLLLIIGSIHGRMDIMATSFLVSFIALLLNNWVFIEPSLVEGSGKNLVLLHFLAGLVLFLFVRQSGRLFRHVEQLVVVVTENAAAEEALHRRLDSAVVTITANLHSLHQSAETAIHSQREMLHAIDEVSVGSQQQADHISDIAENTEETNGTIEQVATTLEQLVETATDAGQKADTGQTNIQVLTDRIDHFSKFFGTMKTSFEHLSEKIEETNSFANAIQAITEQTHLLALNASIEAARAGELGKGFAVVATEIRKLASMTEDTLKKINNNLGQLNDSNELTMEKLIEGELQLSTQLDVANTAGKTFAQLFATMESLQQQLLAFRQDFHSIEQHSESIQKRTMEFASIVQQSSAAIEELNATLVDLTNEQQRIVKTLQETHDEADRLSKTT